MHPKLLTLLLAFGISTLLIAQNRVSIKDPELTFSYVLPAGWNNFDDAYYHYIINADSSAQITLTYFDGMCTSLEDCYAGEVQGKLRSEFADFEIQDEHDDRIAAAPAKWAAFSGKTDGVEVKGLAFFFISHDQFFKVTAFMKNDSPDELADQVVDTVRSITVRLN